MQHAAESNSILGDGANLAPHHSFYPAFSWRLPLLAGLISALFVYALMLFTEKQGRAELARQEALHSLAAVSSVINAIWEKNAALTGALSRQLREASSSDAQAILASYKISYPETLFSVYDRHGYRLVPDHPEAFQDVAPVLHTVRNLVQKALYGQSGRDFTSVRGFLALSVAWPVRGGEVGVLVMSLPLDTLALDKIKEQVRADIALLPFNEFNSDEFLPLSEAASTFSSSDGESASLAKALAPLVGGSTLSEAVTFDFGRSGVSGAFSPLAAPNGNVAGAIVTAPLRPIPASSPLLPLAAALGVALASFAVTAWSLRKRNERLAYLLAQELNDFADNEREGKPARCPDRRKATGLPEPLADSLVRLSTLFRELKAKKDTRDASAQKAQSPCLSAGGADNEHFLRLFDNVPIGVFQADRNGRLSRINPAFALLLGYDSNEQLLLRGSNFADFCIYGGGLLNPLAALAEEPNVSHIIPLRRRDGKVWHFTLVAAYLPSADGGASNSIEGFLMDRQAEENALRAERDRDHARRQRASLALLLAATCRQTRSYLAPSDRGAPLQKDKLFLPAQNADEDAIPGVDPSERRSSVISIASVLNDIYQIAMTEAESSLPVFMPLDLERFFHSLGQQVCGRIHSKGISLHFEIARELPTRLSGPAPLLRHTLERALLVVTEPMQGGRVVISLTRDPNAPSSHGATRVLFSVTWNRLLPETGGETAHSAAAALSNAYTTLLDLPANPEVPHAPSQENDGTLNIAEEQAVISYLLQRMHGNLLEGVFTADTRSMRMTITLPWTSENILGDAELLSAPQDPDMEDTALSIAGQDSASAPAEELAFGPGLGSTLGSLPNATSLELLVMDAPEEDPAAYAQENEAASGNGLDILLVDDNLNHRLFFSLFLRDTRHRITEAHDAQQGIEAFQNARFDVIFLNMEMPLMDGYQATRIIRALEADSGHANTPIVAMTTHALPEFRRQCMLAGCSAFLPKPFTKTALLSTLEAFAQLKDGEQGAAASAS